MSPTWLPDRSRFVSAVHWGSTCARAAAPAARNIFLHRFRVSRLVQAGSTVTIEAAPCLGFGV